MDAENTTKIELRQSKKRKGEKQKANDADTNNHYKKNKTFQESIIQEKQTGKKKTKFTQRIEDSGISLSQRIEDSGISLSQRIEDSGISLSQRIEDSGISLSQRIEDSGKPMEKVSDTTISKDILKEDIDENTKTSKKPSKRQLKREKALQREAQKRHASRISAMQRALSYVSKWKHSRSEWKFEKIRQIWLIDNLLDENSISDTIFPVVLEYFEGCKGMAREILLRKGMDIIRKAEEDEDEESRNGIMESVAYKRARQLLQALPTDR